MSVTIRELVREVLNDNVTEIRRLSAHLRNASNKSDINLAPECGETVLHIAIYKWNRKMVRIFLEAGADPNCVNIQAESAVHVAAKLGLFDILCDLYYSGRCDLNKVTGEGYSALDLCAMELNEEDDFVTMRNFKNWDSRQADDTNAVREGRAKCAEFLREKLLVDYNNKLESITMQSSLWMVKQSKLRHIVAETDFFHPYHTEVQRIEYPEENGIPVIPNCDQKLFENFRIGVQSVSKDQFIHEMINQSISTGLNLASSRLRK